MEKKFIPEFLSYSTCARKFRKKPKKFEKLKKPFPAFFLAKTGKDRPRKREKILLPNYVPTQPELENSKLKKLIPTLFLFKTGWERARKRKKKLFLNSVHTRPRQENSEKNRKKKSKN